MEALLFALGSSRPFGERMAAHLGWALASHEERAFDGGELKTRPLVEVGRRDVYVVQGLHGEPGRSANDKLVQLLFFVAALRDAGAAGVTAIVPYLAYSRKDRRTKPRDPVNSRNVAVLFEAMRARAIVTVEVHNVSAFENAFRNCRPEHVPAAGVLAEHLAASLRDEPVAIVSPDVGGAKRAELVRRELERLTGRPIGKALVDKHRSAGVVSGSLFSGDVAGASVVLVDDLISSGATLTRAAMACRRHGARKIIAAAAHGLFSDGAPALFTVEGPDEVIVSDTVPLPPALASGSAGKITVLPVSSLVAEVIGRTHRGASVSDVLPYD